MSEITKIVLTSSFTIIGGVFVYTISQVLTKFIIDPINEQKKLIGEIADTLIFYDNIYPGFTSFEKAGEVSKKSGNYPPFYNQKHTSYLSTIFLRR
jgi:hypothetical protein